VISIRGSDLAVISSQDIWVHVNTVKLATPTVTPISIEPWIDTEVKIKGGVYASLNAVVKQVRPDGRGSLRLVVYVPSIDCTLEVDLFAVAELKYVFYAMSIYDFLLKVLSELASCCSNTSHFNHTNRRSKSFLNWGQ
jgi:hypothetical protein